MGTTLDAAKLAALLTTANVVGWSPPLAVNVASQSEAPDLRPSYAWWDKTEQLLKVPITNLEGSPASFWMSIGPDSWHMPAYNITDQILAKGTFVCFSWSTTGRFDIQPMVPSPNTYGRVRQARANVYLRNMCGVLQTTLASNQFGPMCVQGYAYGLYDARQSAYATGVQNNALRYVRPSTCYTGVSEDIAVGGSRASSVDILGYLLAFPEQGAAASYPVGAPTLLPMFVVFPWGTTDLTDD